MPTEIQQCLSDALADPAYAGRRQHKSGDGAAAHPPRSIPGCDTATPAPPRIENGLMSAAFLHFLAVVFTLLMLCLSGVAAAADAPPRAQSSPGLLELEQQIQQLRAKNHRVLPLPLISVRSPANPLPYDAPSPTLEIVLPAHDPQSQS